jgi:hypothetical protein
METSKIFPHFLLHLGFNDSGSLFSYLPADLFPVILDFLQALLADYCEVTEVHGGKLRFVFTTDPETLRALSPYGRGSLFLLTCFNVHPQASSARIILYSELELHHLERLFRQGESQTEDERNRESTTCRKRIVFSQLVSERVRKNANITGPIIAAKAEYIQAKPGKHFVLAYKRKDAEKIEGKDRLEREPTTSRDSSEHGTNNNDSDTTDQFARLRSRLSELESWSERSNGKMVTGKDRFFYMHVRHYFAASFPPILEGNLVTLDDIDFTVVCAQPNPCLCYADTKISLECFDDL